MEEGKTAATLAANCNKPPGSILISKGVKGRVTFAVEDVEERGEDDDEVDELEEDDAF